MQRVVSTDEPTTPLWLSHHHDDQWERCIVIGGHHVCRRCAVLYPVAFTTLAVALLMGWGGVYAVAAIWVLPLPAAVEWLAELSGRWSYSARRQVLTTSAAGVALGLAFAAHFRSPFDIDATVPVLAWTAVCVIGGGWVVRSAPAHTDEG